MNSGVALVLVNSAIALALGFASILIIAAIARYAARYFASERASRIAAFGIALGFFLGHSPGARVATLEDLPAVCAVFGGIAGVVAAWAWLLRKGSSEMIDADL